MGLEKHRVQTVLDINSSLKDELIITTNDVFKLHSYIVKNKDITITPSNSMKVNLPSRSNIYKLDKKLSKICKKIPNCDIFVSNNNNTYKETFTDNFGRVMASKVVNNYGVTYYLRGDIAAQMANEGDMFIQCDRSTCSVFSLLNNLSVDFKKFVPSKISGV